MSSCYSRSLSLDSENNSLHFLFNRKTLSFLRCLFELVNQVHHPVGRYALLVILRRMDSQINRNLNSGKIPQNFFEKICKSVTCGLSGWKTMGCEVTDRVAEWQIFGKMRQILGKKWQICSFFGLFCIQTHPFCCCRLHGRPLCSSWETSVFHAVDHRFPRRKPSVSRVEI